LDRFGFQTFGSQLLVDFADVDDSDDDEAVSFGAAGDGDSSEVVSFAVAGVCNGEVAPGTSVSVAGSVPTDGRVHSHFDCGFLRERVDAATVVAVDAVVTATASSERKRCPTSSSFIAR
jgi:hypothetical protein